MRAFGRIAIEGMGSKAGLSPSRPLGADWQCL